MTNHSATPSMGTCPHCGASSPVEASTAFRFRCSICGGPRVPVNLPEVVRSGREDANLRAARVLRRRRVIWRAVAVALALIGLPWLAITLITLLLAAAGALYWALFTLMASVPVVLAAICWRHADLLSKQLYAHLDAGRRLVAEDVLRGDAELTAEQLAYALSIEEGVAEQLLAELSVDDKVHSRVTDDGRVVYSTRSPIRLRLDEEPADVEDLDAWDAARRRSHSS